MAGSGAQRWKDRGGICSLTGKKRASQVMRWHGICLPRQETQRCGSSLWLGRSPGAGNSNPLRYSCLENSVDRGALQATVQSHKELDTTEPTGTGMQERKTSPSLVGLKLSTTINCFMFIICDKEPPFSGSLQDPWNTGIRAWRLVPSTWYPTKLALVFVHKEGSGYW